MARRWTAEQLFKKWTSSFLRYTYTNRILTMLFVSPTFTSLHGNKYCLNLSFYRYRWVSWTELRAQKINVDFLNEVAATLWREVGKELGLKPHQLDCIET